MSEDHNARVPHGWKLIIAVYIGLVGLFFVIYEVVGIEVQGAIRPNTDYEPLLPIPEAWALPLLVVIGAVGFIGTAINIHTWYRSRG